MKKSTKKALIIGGVVGGVAIMAYVMYRNLKKALDFIIKPRSLKVLSKDVSGVKLLLGLSLKNKSKMKYTLTKQRYDIYLNGILITTIESDKPQTMLPESASPLSLNLDLNYADLGKRLNVASGVGLLDKLQTLTNLGGQLLKVDAQVSVKYGILPSIPIRYVDEGNLATWGLEKQ